MNLLNWSFNMIGNTWSDAFVWAFVFSVGDLMLNTFLTLAFGGKFRLSIRKPRSREEWEKT